MILPILSYGNPILKKKCDEIDSSYPNLKNLLQDMWETMYNACLLYTSPSPRDR